MKQLHRILVYSLLFSFSCTSQAETLFDLDFEAPHVDGSSPSVGEASNLPTRVLRQTLIESGFANMTGQSMVFHSDANTYGPSASYDAASFHIYDPAVSTYTISFDMATENLIGSGDRFTIFLDTPAVKSITVESSGVIQYYGGLSGVFTTPYTDGSLIQVEMVFDAANQLLDVSINGTLWLDDLSIEKGYLKNLRFSYDPNNGYTDYPQIAIDNLKIDVAYRTGNRNDNYRGLQAVWDIQDISEGTLLRDFITRSTRDIDALSEGNGTIGNKVASTDGKYIIIDNASSHTVRLIQGLSESAVTHEVSFDLITQDLKGSNAKLEINFIEVQSTHDVAIKPDGNVVLASNAAVGIHNDAQLTNYRILYNELTGDISIYQNGALLGASTTTVLNPRFLHIGIRPNAYSSAAFALPKATLGISNFIISEGDTIVSDLSASLGNANGCSKGVSAVDINIENLGTHEAQELTSQIEVPSGYTLASFTNAASCTQSGNIIDCSLNNLAANASVDLGLKINDLNCGDQFTVSADVQSSSYDVDRSNNNATKLAGGAMEEDASVKPGSTSPLFIMLLLFLFYRKEYY